MSTIIIIIIMVWVARLGERELTQTFNPEILPEWQHLEQMDPGIIAGYNNFASLELQAFWKKSALHLSCNSLCAHVCGCNCID